MLGKKTDQSKKSQRSHNDGKDCKYNQDSAKPEFLVILFVKVVVAEKVIKRIKWNDFVHTATLTGSLTYEGIEWNGANDTATTNFLDHLLDTIKSNFEVTGSSEPYETNLGPKLYLGASLTLLPSLDVGILSRIDFLNSGTKANVMIHVNWEPSTVFSLAATYSPFGGRASTFGLGFSLRGGPIAFYTVADYRAFRYNLYKYEKYPVFIAPNGRTRFNLQIGFNIMIGANQRKRLMRDKPMYFSDES